jgi:hypothetical protein
MSTFDDLAAGDLVYRDSVSAAPLGGGGSGSGTNKLWLPLWSGEVINAYDQYNMFENMITTKTLTGGFSYEFPITGTVALNPAWNAGVELNGGDAESKTFKVNLDSRPMAAHFETDNVDLLVTQWDYRSELARQAGLTLANTRDRQIAMALAAACAVAPISSDPRGSSFTSGAFQAPGVVSTTVAASSCTDAQALKVLEEIENYLVACQENDVTIGQPYCVVTPKVFQVIRALGIPRTNTAFANSPLFGASDNYGANGAPISMGMNMMTDALDYMGVKIVKSNHLPKTDLANAATANKIGGAKYNLNAASAAYSSTTGQGYTAFSFYGIIFQAEAIAGLSLMGMKVDTVQDVRRNTQFTVASMLKGTGLIRPEMCKAIISGDAVDTTNDRTSLRDHLNGYGTSGVGAEHNNLDNGFGAEYANI